eukprot:6205159-Pleurochrysis_carterae.AAC.2
MHGRPRRRRARARRLRLFARGRHYERGKPLVPHVLGEEGVRRRVFPQKRREDAKHTVAGQQLAARC